MTDSIRRNGSVEHAPLRLADWQSAPGQIWQLAGRIFYQSGGTVLWSRCKEHWPAGTIAYLDSESGVWWFIDTFDWASEMVYQDGPFEHFLLPFHIKTRRARLRVTGTCGGRTNMASSV